MSRFLDAYKPERHYMRGPGPKWHAKHASSLMVAASAQPLGNLQSRGNGVWALGTRMFSWVAPTAAAATLGFMAVIALA